MRRKAACACGGLTIQLEGDPQMVSSCCCQQCQRRTGSLIGVTAFFAREQIVETSGEAGAYRRVADSGNGLTFHFCRTCGATVFWYPEARPDNVAVAVGAFADPAFPAPERMIWCESRHPWVRIPDGVRTYERGPS